MTEKELRDFMKWLEERCYMEYSSEDIIEAAKEAGLIEPEDEGEWIEYCDGWKMRFKDGE
jgi:hypothetical protein